MTGPRREFEDDAHDHTIHRASAQKISMNTSSSATGRSVTLVKPTARYSLAHRPAVGRALGVFSMMTNIINDLFHMKFYE